MTQEMTNGTAKGGLTTRVVSPKKAKTKLPKGVRTFRWIFILKHPLGPGRSNELIIYADDSPAAIARYEAAGFSIGDLEDFGLAGHLGDGGRINFDRYGGQLLVDGIVAPGAGKG